MKLLFKRVLEIVITIMFGMLFLSIPLFSFRPNYTFITWIVLITLLLVAGIHFIIFDRLQISINNLILLTFIPICLFSTLLNGIHKEYFRWTDILLVLISIIFMLFFRNNKHIIKNVFLSCFFGCLTFGLFYLIKYGNNILHGQYYRLGSYFGDINNIAIFLSFGMCIGINYIFYKKKIFLKILYGISALFLFLLSFTTGSKIVIFLFVFTFLFLVFKHFGKKRIWISLIIASVFIVTFIIVLSLPRFVTIRQRFFDFISTLLGFSFSGGDLVDASTIERTQYFMGGIDLFLRKPVFGFGIQGFAIFGGMNDGWSHNTVSESLCNFGLVGTFALFWNFFYCVYRSFKHNSDHGCDNNNLCFVLLVFFIVCSFTVVLNFEKLFSFIIGIVYAYYDNSKIIADVQLIAGRRKEYENNSVGK